MAYTLNGFGTTFYGKADPDADGSYVTTEWVVLAYIPIIPFRSYRLRPEGAKLSILGSGETYSVLEKLPILWPQVLRTYAFVLGMFLWAAVVTFSAIRYLGMLKNPDDVYMVDGAMIFFFALLLAPLLFLFWCRKRSSRSKEQTTASREMSMSADARRIRT